MGLFVKRWLPTDGHITTFGINLSIWNPSPPSYCILGSGYGFPFWRHIPVWLWGVLVRMHCFHCNFLCRHEAIVIVHRGLVTVPSKHNDQSDSATNKQQWGLIANGLVCTIICGVPKVFRGYDNIYAYVITIKNVISLSIAKVATITATATIHTPKTNNKRWQTMCTVMAPNELWFL